MVPRVGVRPTGVAPRASDRSDGAPCVHDHRETLRRRADQKVGREVAAGDEIAGEGRADEARGAGEAPPLAGGGSLLGELRRGAVQPEGEREREGHGGAYSPVRFIAKRMKRSI